MAARLSETEVLDPGTAEAWHAWLEAHHDTSPGVWLVIGKKGNPVTPLAYEQAVEEALAFGWIDSTVNRLDEHRVKQLYTPRRRGSTWALSNKCRVERLAAEGRLQPAGTAVIEAAKADGTWSMLDDVEALVVPHDLAEALASNPQASAGFHALPDSAKKQALYWVISAKRPETRARRIQVTVEAAAAGKPPR